MSESDEHLKPLRLFDLARKSALELTDEERGHYMNCEQCQRVYAVFARQFRKESTQKDKGDAA